MIERLEMIMYTVQSFALSCKINTYRPYQTTAPSFLALSLAISHMAWIASSFSCFKLLVLIRLCMSSMITGRLLPFTKTLYAMSSAIFK